jgi:hypothetical protein
MEGTVLLPAILNRECSIPVRNGPPAEAAQRIHAQMDASSPEINHSAESGI